MRGEERSSNGGSSRASIAERAETVRLLLLRLLLLRLLLLLLLLL